MRILPLLVFIFVQFSCGSASRDRSGRQNSEIKANESILIFSATDVKFESSALYALNLESENLQTILSGQSSDLLVKIIDKQIFAINRQAGYQSFQKITFEENDSGVMTFAPGKAVALKGLSPGDPHDILKLDDQHLLLVNYVGQQLAALDLSSGELDFFDAPLSGISKGSPLRFESAVKVDSEKLLIVKQGLDSMYRIDNSQGVYAFKWDGKRLHSADTKSSLLAKMSGSLPVGLFPDKEVATYSSLSICSTTFSGCQTSLDSFAVKESTYAAVADLANLKLQFNGGTIHDPVSQAIYASVVNANGEKVLLQVDQKTGATKDFYTFPKGLFNGYWGLFFDKQGQRLIVGDAASERRGKLMLFEGEKLKKEIQVPAIPYSGEVLSLSR